MFVGYETEPHLLDFNIFLGLRAVEQGCVDFVQFFVPLLQIHDATVFWKAGNEMLSGLGYFSRGAPYFLEELINGKIQSFPFKAECGEVSMWKGARTEIVMLYKYCSPTMSFRMITKELL